MSPKADVVRPCGNLEKYSTARHSLGLYRCVAVAGRYAVPPGASLEEVKTTLRGAIAQVAAEQPFMRVGIADEDKQTTSFVRVPQINLSNHIQWFGPSHPGDGAGASDAALCRHLSYQHDQLWPDLERRPPWKVAIIPIQRDEDGVSEIEVVYFFHHAISDGTSGSIFHKRLLQALSNPVVVQGLQNDSLDLPKPPALPLSQEQLVNGRISWSYFLWELWGAFGPSWLKSKPDVTPWTGQDADFSTPFHTNVRIVRLPASTVAGLLAASRAQGLTLTPLLHALVAASLARHLPASAAPAFEPSSAISMRRFVKDANADIDNQMSVLVTSTNHPISKERTTLLRESSGDTLERAIWNVAGSVKSDLKTRLATLPHDDITAMLRYVGDFHDFFKKKDGSARGNSWEVSNLGAINGEGEGEGWKLTRAVFSQSAGTIAPPVCVNAAGVAGGETTVTLTWNESIIETKLVEALAADLELWTQKLAAGETL
ncbi:hypothetical protein CORC01_06555 [Colletotrichum orchidophilum]|uniref:Alcohol acetyltransferase n=1 Tax=Colletotrichum orchidophilum TaxID=1209926 RepID=A0A1G4B9V4_9PEZI|nr:uncharacterized protein CORC01_06555 [Colletotrichum orchidophilum]OHE98187.1 hypothetical protein CORC01_06555 [Colletotrichum orchidophilum]